jgi:chromosome segregation ATPase
MIFLIINISIIIIAAAGVIFYQKKQQSAFAEISNRQANILVEEINQKKSLLSALSTLILGYCTETDLKQIKEEQSSLQETLRIELGKLAVAEAEMASVDKRLRDLEELTKELEASKLEHDKELEILRDQERAIKKETEALRQALEKSLSSLDQLLAELSHSQGAVSALNSAKADLISTEEKIRFYEDEILKLNSKYMQLKRGYDALDIEYAQLYERQNALG